MRKWMLGAIAALLAWPTAAPAQESRPTWWFVITDELHPPMVADYEALAKQFHDMVAPHLDADMTYYTLSGSDLGFLYALPMESMEAFSGLNAKWQTMIDEVGRDKYMALSRKSDAAVKQRKANFFIQRDDLSYDPASPRMPLAELPMRHYDWMYPIPGMESEFEALMKEWIAAYRSHDLGTGWVVYQAVTGDDLPAYVIATPARDRADFEEDGKTIQKALGDQGDALWKKTMGRMRDFRHVDAWMRPELSVVPSGG